MIIYVSPIINFIAISAMLLLIYDCPSSFAAKVIFNIEGKQNLSNPKHKIQRLNMGDVSSWHQDKGNWRDWTALIKITPTYWPHWSQHISRLIVYDHQKFTSNAVLKTYLQDRLCLLIARQKYLKRRT